MDVRHETPLPVSAAEAFAWHERPAALQRLAPPWDEVVVEEQGRGVAPGTRVVLRAGPGPAWMKPRWVMEHGEWEPGRRFTDRMLAGPFRDYRHTHAFADAGDGTSRLVDHIHCRLPLGIAGRLLGEAFARRALDRLFAYRHAVTRADLRRWRERGHAAPMRILVSGSSGLLGSVLLPFLSTQGHDVRRLVRRPDTAWPMLGQAVWDPQERAEAPAGVFDGIEAVVHLGGANVGDGRWTEERRRHIRESRVVSTGRIAAALAALPPGRRPSSLVCASATGFYGNTGDREVDETAPAGEGFLADVCRAWEEAAGPARDAGVRVVHARFGIILSPAGGVLAKMLPPFRAGLGGPAGSGGQWVSWIASDDAAAAVLRCVEDAGLRGPVNVVSPQPVTNRAFAAALGAALGRPSSLCAPATALRLAFGRMADETVLASSRVRPAALLATGFRWDLPEIGAALRRMLGRETP